jgi:peptidoglycan/LPS O-acetylase OafA/YrhL
MSIAIDSRTLDVPRDQAIVKAGTIKNIQAMRGIASLVVFLGHALLLQPGLGLDQYFSFFGVFASAGVDIFFVISGFIITTVAMKAGDQDGGRARIAWNFGVNRFSRIYPVYWIAFALAVAASHKVQLAPPNLPVDPLWQQGLLLTHVNTYIMAAWSLCFEIYFYAVVMLALLISPKHVGKVLAGWAVLITLIVAYDMFIGKNQWVAQVALSPLTFEFIFGMIVAYLIRRGITAYAVTAAFIGVVTFLAGAEYMRHLGWWTLIPWYRVFYSGIPSAFILYAIIAIEYRGMWTFSSRWMALGDSSYSIYVWHQLIFYSILTVATHFGLVGHVPTFILISMWIIPAFLFGIFSYWRLEMPLQAFLKNRLLIKD